jgi:hypothetical protein
MNSLAGTPSSPADQTKPVSVSPASSGNPKTNNATAIKDLRVATVHYGDYAPENLPELPFGLYYEPSDGAGNERLRSYTLVENLETGTYAGLIKRLQEKQQISPERIVTIASNFLGKVVTHFGKYSLLEIARRYGTTPALIIEKMYMADVISLIFACRLKVVGSSVDFSDDLKPEDLPRTAFDMAIDTECGCKRAERIKYDPRESDDYSLRNVEMKLLDTTDTAKPVFEIPLPRGFMESDGGSNKITKFFVEPLKWFQLGIIAGKGKSNEANDDLKTFMAMIVAIPESEIYGMSKNTHPFCKDLYDAMSAFDINKVNESLTALNLGPEANRQIQCYHCDQKVPYQIPWVAMSLFIYSSDVLAKTP